MCSRTAQNKSARNKLTATALFHSGCSCYRCIYLVGDLLSPVGESNHSFPLHLDLYLGRRTKMEGKAYVKSSLGRCLDGCMYFQAYMKVYPISSYRVINDISEIAIARDVIFLLDNSKIQTSNKHTERKAKSCSFLPLTAGTHIGGLRSSHYNMSGILHCNKSCTASRLEVLSVFLHHLPLFLLILWKPDQLWFKYTQEPQVQNK